MKPPENGRGGPRKEAAPIQTDQGSDSSKVSNAPCGEIIEKHESRDLVRLEAVIEKGLDTFVHVGNALAEIRDRKLYRVEHKTFEDYCREKWNMGRTYAHRVMAAAAVEEMLPAGNKPKTERQARPLTKLPKEKRAEVWQAAVEASPSGQPTTAEVEAVVAAKTTSTSGVRIYKHFSHTTPFSEAENDNEMAEIMRLKYPKACSNLETGAGFFYRMVKEVREYDAWKVVGFASFEDFCRDELGKTLAEVEEIVEGVKEIGIKTNSAPKEKSVDELTDNLCGTLCALAKHPDNNRVHVEVIRILLVYIAGLTRSDLRTADEGGLINDAVIKTSAIARALKKEVTK